jgi:3-phenylpropionate/trans-cinnamate dioxygenase ferredoxin subunit
MANLTQIAGSNDLTEGTMKKYQIEGTEILLARIEGKYYATQNRCPHLGGDLSNGKLEGSIVTCPKHNSQFDLKDGKVVRWLKGSGFMAAVGKALKSPSPLKTYNVQVQDDKILIEL